jgi:hypothetical protein
MSKGTEQTPSPPADVTTVFFLPGIFNETLQLLLDAHEYFSIFGGEDQNRYNGDSKTVYSCEMSRITLRLSSVMAWLMVRRAVFAGKILPQDAAEKFRLDCEEVCLDTNPQADGMLPSYMCHLLSRTLELYQRVHRLQGMIATTTIH